MVNNSDNINQTSNRLKQLNEQNMVHFKIMYSN
jgi:hypothetical protein